MAAMLRNNNVRLSVITDAFGRLQLQQTKSIPIFHQPGGLRSFTQACPNFLKNPTAADPKLASHRARSSHKPTSTSDVFPLITQRPLPAQTFETQPKPRRTSKRHVYLLWTDEEDRELWRLVKENMSNYGIYSGHFRHRTLASVSTRICSVRTAIALLERQAKEGVRTEEVDVAKAVAGGEGAMPLRKVYDKMVRSRRERRRKIDKSDDTVLHYQWNREYRDAISSKGKWTREEDELLEKLVKQYRHIPEPALWSKISGGGIGDTLLLRSMTSCRQRWRVLHLPPMGQTGLWSREEERRLQAAIWEQLEGKYQVAVDVLVGKPVTTENPLGKWRPELEQLPDQAGLPLLKQGSRRLRMLDWAAIQKIVKSRSEIDCRQHFYHVYHNANRNRWSKEELTRFEEGVEMFGKDTWKIAEHIGTRAPLQVIRLLSYRRGKMKKGKEEAAMDKKDTVGAVTEH